MLSDRELSEMRQRAERAAKAPWKAFVEGRDMDCGATFIRTQGADIELIGAAEADCDFIAHAREDILRLLDEIEALRSNQTDCAQK